MAIGDQAGKAAVDELTTKTIPELMDRMDALAARLAALLKRLDGVTIMLRLAPAEPDLTMAEARKMSADIASGMAAALAAYQEPGH